MTVVDGLPPIRSEYYANIIVMLPSSDKSWRNTLWSSEGVRKVFFLFETVALFWQAECRMQSQITRNTTR